MPKELTTEERLARLERLCGLGEPIADCTLCKGKGVVNWGVPHRMGGTPGPCLCVQPAFRKKT